jgi:hypothetical protein
VSRVPVGELGDFVKESMEPYGYSVVLCRNCNRSYGPRLVSENDYPPLLDEANLEDGTNIRINARVEFGVTSSAFLYNAYKGPLGITNLMIIFALSPKLRTRFIFYSLQKRNQA